MEEFTILPEHLKLLRRANLDWEDCEYGAPAIDCKRPYGNSSVESDIFEILEWKPDTPNDEYEPYSQQQYDRARKLHTDTLTVLQIALCTGKFEEGMYIKKDKYDYRSWVKKDLTQSKEGV